MEFVEALVRFPVVAILPGEKVELEGTEADVAGVLGNDGKIVEAVAVAGGVEVP